MTWRRELPAVSDSMSVYVSPFVPFRSFSVSLSPVHMSVCLSSVCLAAWLLFLSSYTPAYVRTHIYTHHQYTWLPGCLSVCVTSSYVSRLVSVCRTHQYLSACRQRVGRFRMYDKGTVAIHVYVCMCTYIYMTHGPLLYRHPPTHTTQTPTRETDRDI